ncbi:MAG: hypothetical protein V1866_06445 [archaeon]
MVSFYTYLGLYLNDLRKKVSLSEFEKHFKTPHQTIKKHLAVLVSSRILLEEKKARFRFYSLNLKNPLLVEYLSICEKERLFALLEKSTLINRLYQLASGSLKNALIFGSATTSKDYDDIDLLALTKDGRLKAELKQFENTYGKKVHLIQTGEKDLTPAFLEEIKQKHIILNNHDYIIRVIYKNELGLVQETRYEAD